MQKEATYDIQYKRFFFSSHEPFFSVGFYLRRKKNKVNQSRNIFIRYNLMHLFVLQDFPTPQTCVVVILRLVTMWK